MGSDVVVEDQQGGLDLFYCYYGVVTREWS